MKLITLVENQTESKNLKNKHGLSFYIESNGIKIIFDTGPDDTFFKNANKLGIKVSDVDFLIISHGHVDHGGGIEAFIKHNHKARIIMSKYALDRYYSKLFKFIKFDVGLNAGLKNSERIEFIEGTKNLKNGLLLFDGVKAEKLFPKSNSKLLKKTDDGFIEDDFKHEINLIISEEERIILICGCAHKGIINIIKKAESIIQRDINVVVGGMHLYNPITKRYESNEFIKELGSSLSKNKVVDYFTCHCTGEKAYKILNKKLKGKINYLKTGSIIKV